MKKAGEVRGESFPGAERGGCCRWLWWHGEPGRQGGDADSAVTAALPPSQVSDSLPQGLTLHIAAASLYGKATKKDFTRRNDAYFSIGNSTSNCVAAMAMRALQF